MVVNKSCPVCSSKNLKIWDIGYKKCDGCGAAFRDKFPTLEELREIYENYYSKDNINQNQTNMVSNVISLKNQVKFIKRKFPSVNKILDFGSGTGDFVKLLKDEGFHVEGCEFSDDARKEAEIKYGFQFHANLDSLSENKYDLITSIEVFEHLTDPGEIVEKLGALLSNKGTMYITTPNLNGLQSRLFRRKWREAEKPFHLIFFNFRSLKILLNSRGLKNVKFIRFSPLTTDNKVKKSIHYAFQLFGLYGGLRVLSKFD